MSFDRIAPVYDTLSRLVYGKSMVASQRHFLAAISSHATVLIIGGGTGWIVQELFAVNSTCSVVYVEASQEMIRQTEKKIKPKDASRIRFVWSEEIPVGAVYDCIITNFFLDLFSEQHASNRIHQIKNILKEDGCWIVTDFVDEGRWWQKILLKSMYIFFRTLSKIEATSLPPWRLQLEREGLRRKASQKFYHGFIESSLYVHVHKPLT
ncbi:class I SAM-dependent methyltransferase [Ohtaekwangia sp.]|uniref:class I SAM-dependent methyltransferase n=1 Tax=Ohtaekwangia sp. TaxID=2066019 RepID=UPI002FDE2386